MSSKNQFRFVSPDEAEAANRHRQRNTFVMYHYWEEASHYVSKRSGLIIYDYDQAFDEWESFFFGQYPIIILHTCNSVCPKKVRRLMFLWMVEDK